ncbi:MAG: histidine phosphatase family protein [Candidatus Nanopelagicales bacterium]
MRTLVVVRHAKSSWPDGVPDPERPLGSRGRRDAPVMGKRLGELVGPIDVALISPAHRAQETWALMRPHLVVGEWRTEARVYRDWGRDVIDAIRELPDSAGSALVLGHEPGVSELVLMLSDPANPGLLSRVANKFPTCAFAVLTADQVWSGLEPSCAQLDAFSTPKD